MYKKTFASLHMGPATEEQIAEVCHIMRESYVPELLRGTIYESDRFDRYLVERHRQGDLFLVGIEPSLRTVVGFSQVLDLDTALHVNHLVVRRAAHGLGIGAQLLQNIMARAQVAGRNVTLDVDSRNARAISFYKRAGFEVQGETPVAMIGRKSGTMPLGLTKHSDDYKKYGFCHVDQKLSSTRIRIGVIGSRSIRLLASDIKLGFDWNEFSEWAQWADVFVFGAVKIDPRVDVQETWSVFRMKR